MSNELYYYRPSVERDNRSLEADVCIYGGNAAGVAAAVALARSGKSAVVVEPGAHLGGLSSGGLSETDIGNKDAIGGISREFYRATGAHYGIEEEWKFEPHVAEVIFEDWLAATGFTLLRRQFVASVQKEGSRLRSLTTTSGTQIRAKMFIDASYEGDLLALAGVDYHVGRESNAHYGETLNGVQVRNMHQFQFKVDPYIVAGDAGSGLLPDIDGTGPLEGGTGDHRVQAYNFRLCLTQKAENKAAWERPDDYDALQYELLARYLAAGGGEEQRFKFDKIRGEKVDKNNFGAISTDFIGGNWAFPNATYGEREIIFQEHVRWHKGLFWFLMTDQRVPSEVREWTNSWGPARDEFIATGHWPHQLYIREARRMVTDYVMTEAHCRGQKLCDDPISLAAYTMDSHNCRRFVQNGSVLNDGDVQVHGFPPYPISFRSIIPRRSECENLIVPVCLAASHIAYGSIRMEPVFMITGQSAATIAAMALDSGSIAVQDVPYAALRQRLESDGQVLHWNAS